MSVEVFIGVTRMKGRGARAEHKKSWISTQLKFHSVALFKILS